MNKRFMFSILIGLMLAGCAVDATDSDSDESGAYLEEDTGEGSSEILDGYNGMPRPTKPTGNQKTPECDCCGCQVPPPPPFAPDDLDGSGGSAAE